VTRNEEVIACPDQARRPEPEADDGQGVDEKNQEMKVQGFRGFKRFRGF
jgi:hypothetical protein